MQTMQRAEAAGCTIFSHEQLLLGQSRAVKHCQLGFTDPWQGKGVRRNLIQDRKPKARSSRHAGRCPAALIVLVVNIRVLQVACQAGSCTCAGCSNAKHTPEKLGKQPRQAAWAPRQPGIVSTAPERGELAGGAHINNLCV